MLRGPKPSRGIEPRLVLHAPAQSGDHAVIFVKGYWSHNEASETDNRGYVTAIRKAGFGGNIYQLQWDAGRFSEVFAPMLLKFGARIAAAVLTRRIMPPLRRAAWAPAELMDFFHDWRAAFTRAEVAGAKLFTQAHAELGARPVTLLAHSLGARVAHFALRAAAESEFRFQDAVLLGGAHPRHDSAWVDAAQGVRGRIFNVYHARDPILRYAYRAGALTTRGPCGLQPIRPAHRGIRNIDASAQLDRYYNAHNRYTDHLDEILGAHWRGELFGTEEAEKLRDETEE